MAIPLQTAPDDVTSTATGKPKAGGAESMAVIEAPTPKAGGKEQDPPVEPEKFTKFSILKELQSHLGRNASPNKFGVTLKQEGGKKKIYDFLNDKRGGTLPEFNEWAKAFDYVAPPPEPVEGVPYKLTPTQRREAAKNKKEFGTKAAGELFENTKGAGDLSEYRKPVERSERLLPTEAGEFYTWWNTDQDVLAWRHEIALKHRVDPDPMDADYDYVAAWKAGIVPEKTDVDEGKASSARALRPTSRNNKLIEGWKPTDGEASSHLMASATVDGKNVAYPTLFPIDPNNITSDPSGWMEMTEENGYDKWDALKEAHKRGEIFFFDTREEAEGFAKGDWKGKRHWASVDPETGGYLKGEAHPTRWKEEHYQTFGFDPDAYGIDVEQSLELTLLEAQSRGAFDDDIYPADSPYPLPTWKELNLTLREPTEAEKIERAAKKVAKDREAFRLRNSLNNLAGINKSKTFQEEMSGSQKPKKEGEEETPETNLKEGITPETEQFHRYKPLSQLGMFFLTPAERSIAEVLKKEVEVIEKSELKADGSLRPDSDLSQKWSTRTLDKAQSISPEWSPLYNPTDYTTKLAMFGVYEAAMAELHEAAYQFKRVAVGAGYSYKREEKDAKEQPEISNQQSRTLENLAANRRRAQETYERLYSLFGMDADGVYPEVYIGSGDNHALRDTYNMFALGVERLTPDFLPNSSATEQFLEAKMRFETAFDNMRDMSRVFLTNNSFAETKNTSIPKRFMEKALEGNMGAVAPKNMGIGIKTEEDARMNAFSSLYHNGIYDVMKQTGMYSNKTLEDLMDKTGRSPVTGELFADFSGGLGGFLPTLYVARGTIMKFGGKNAQMMFQAMRRSKVPSTRRWGVLGNILLEEAVFQAAGGEIGAGAGFGAAGMATEFMHGRTFGGKYGGIISAIGNKFLAMATTGVTMTSAMEFSKLTGALAHNIIEGGDGERFIEALQLRNNRGEMIELSDFAKHKLIEMTVNSFFGLAHGNLKADVRDHINPRIDEGKVKWLDKERMEIRQLARELEKKGYKDMADEMYHWNNSLPLTIRRNMSLISEVGRSADATGVPYFSKNQRYKVADGDVGMTREVTKDEKNKLIINEDGHLVYSEPKKSITDELSDADMVKENPDFDLAKKHNISDDIYELAFRGKTATETAAELYGQIKKGSIVVKDHNGVPIKGRKAKARLKEIVEAAHKQKAVPSIDKLRELENEFMIHTAIGRNGEKYRAKQKELGQIEYEIKFHKEQVEKAGEEPSQYDASAIAIKDLEVKKIKKQAEIDGMKVDKRIREIAKNVEDIQDQYNNWRASADRLFYERPVERIGVRDVVTDPAEIDQRVQEYVDKEGETFQLKPTYKIDGKEVNEKTALEYLNKSSNRDKILRGESDVSAENITGDNAVINSLRRINRTEKPFGEYAESESRNTTFKDADGAQVYRTEEDGSYRRGKLVKEKGGEYTFRSGSGKEADSKPVSRSEEGGVDVRETLEGAVEQGAVVEKEGTKGRLIKGEGGRYAIETADGKVYDVAPSQPKDRLEDHNIKPLGSERRIEDTDKLGEKGFTLADPLMEQPVRTKRKQPSELSADGKRITKGKEVYEVKEVRKNEKGKVTSIGAQKLDAKGKPVGKKVSLRNDDVLYQMELFNRQPPAKGVKFSTVEEHEGERYIVEHEGEHEVSRTKLTTVEKQREAEVEAEQKAEVKKQEAEAEAEAEIDEFLKEEPELAEELEKEFESEKVEEKTPETEEVEAAEEKPKSLIDELLDELTDEDLAEFGLETTKKGTIEAMETSSGKTPEEIKKAKVRALIGKMLKDKKELLADQRFQKKVSDLYDAMSEQAEMVGSKEQYAEYVASVASGLTPNVHGKRHIGSKAKGVVYTHPTEKLGFVDGYDGLRAEPYLINQRKEEAIGEFDTSPLIAGEYRIEAPEQSHMLGSVEDISNFTKGIEDGKYGGIPTEQSGTGGAAKGVRPEGGKATGEPDGGSGGKGQSGTDGDRGEVDADPIKPDAPKRTVLTSDEGEGDTGRPPLHGTHYGDLPEPTTHINDGKYDIDEHQLYALNQILTRFYDNEGEGFVLADGTGVGKTRILLTSAREIADRTGKPVLIITENKQILETAFKPEAERAGVNLDNIEMTTYDGIKGEGGLKEDFQKDYGAVMFDEAHNLKNPTSDKSATALTITADKHLFATATPMDRPTGATYFFEKMLGIPKAQIMAQLGFKLKPMVHPKTGKTFDMPILMEGFEWKDVFQNMLKMRDDAELKGAFLRRHYPFYGEILENNLFLSTEDAAITDAHVRNWLDKIEDGGKKAGFMKGQMLFETSRLNEKLKLDALYPEIQEALVRGEKVIVIAETVNPSVLRGMTEREYFEKRQWGIKAQLSSEHGEKVDELMNALMMVRGGERNEGTTHDGSLAEHYMAMARMRDAVRKQEKLEEILDFEQIILEIPDVKRFIDMAEKIMDDKSMPIELRQFAEEIEMNGNPVKRNQAYIDGETTRMRENKRPIDREGDAIINSMINELGGRLKEDGFSFGKIYGKGDKTGEVDKFQNDENDVVIATPKSGGTGISLDDQVGGMPRKMYITTANFAGDLFQQILGRISRKNTKSASSAEIIYANTLRAGMAETVYSDGKRKDIVAQKLKVLKAIQEGLDPDVARGLKIDGEEGDVTEEITGSGKSKAVPLTDILPPAKGKPKPKPPEDPNEPLVLNEDYAKWVRDEEISDDIILGIAQKRMDGKPLTKREKAIHDHPVKYKEIQELIDEPPKEEKPRGARPSGGSSSRPKATPSGGSEKRPDGEKVTGAKKKVKEAEAGVKKAQDEAEAEKAAGKKDVPSEVKGEQDRTLKALTEPFQDPNGSTWAQFNEKGEVVAVGYLEDGKVVQNDSPNNERNLKRIKPLWEEFKRRNEIAHSPELADVLQLIGEKGADGAREFFEQFTYEERGTSPSSTDAESAAGVANWLFHKEPSQTKFIAEKTKEALTGEKPTPSESGEKVRAAEEELKKAQEELGKAEEEETKSVEETPTEEPPKKEVEPEAPKPIKDYDEVLRNPKEVERLLKEKFISDNKAFSNMESWKVAGNENQIEYGDFISNEGKKVTVHDERGLREAVIGNVLRNTPYAKDVKNVEYDKATGHVRFTIEFENGKEVKASLSAVEPNLLGTEHIPNSGSDASITRTGLLTARYAVEAGYDNAGGLTALTKAYVSAKKRSPSRRSLTEKKLVEEVEDVIVPKQQEKRTFGNPKSPRVRGGVHEFNDNATIQDPFSGEVFTVLFSDTKQPMLVTHDQKAHSIIPHPDREFILIGESGTIDASRMYHNDVTDAYLQKHIDAGGKVINLDEYNGNVRERKGEGFVEDFDPANYGGKPVYAVMEDFANAQKDMENTVYLVFRSIGKEYDKALEDLEDSEGTGAEAQEIRDAIAENQAESSKHIKEFTEKRTAAIEKLNNYILERAEKNYNFFDQVERMSFLTDYERATTLRDQVTKNLDTLIDELVELRNTQKKAAETETRGATKEGEFNAVSGFRDAVKSDKSAGVVVKGSETSISMPDGSERGARFAVVEGSEVAPSHILHSVDRVEVHPLYPTQEGVETINPTDYKNDKQALKHTWDISNNVKPHKMITNAAEPSVGVPVISIDGVVKSGNGRTIAFQRAIREGNLEAYNKHLQEHISEYGIKPSEIAHMENPMLVKIDMSNIGGEYTVVELSKFNGDPQKVKSPTQKAIEYSRMVAGEEFDGVKKRMAEVLSEVGADGKPRYKNFSEFFKDKAAVKRMIDVLTQEKVILEKDAAVYFDAAKGQFTDQGKVLFQTVLQGGLFDARVVEALIDGKLKGLNKDKVSKLLLPLYKMKALDPQFDIVPMVNEAMYLISQHRASTYTGDLASFLKMPRTAGETPSIPEVNALAILIGETSGRAATYKARDIQRFLDEYTKRALEAKGGTLFAADPKNLTPRSLIDGIASENAHYEKLVDMLRFTDEVKGTKDAMMRKNTQGKTEHQVIGSSIPFRHTGNAAVWRKSELNNVQTLQDIARDFFRDVGIKGGKEARAGHQKVAGRSALGWYNSENGIFMFKSIDDLPTIFHEFGHKVDLEKVFGGRSGSGELNFTTQELLVIEAHERGNHTAIAQHRRTMGDKVVDTLLHKNEIRTQAIKFLEDIDHYHKANDEKGLREALAEGFSRLIVNPEYLETKAPIFHEFLTDLIKTNPKLERAMYDAKIKVEILKKKDTRFRDMVGGVAYYKTKARLFSAMKWLRDGDAISALFDSDHWIKKINDDLLRENPNLPTGQQPIYDVLSSRGISGKVNQWVNRNPFLTHVDAYGKKHIQILHNVKPLTKILEPAMDKIGIQGTDLILAYHRAVDLHRISKEAKTEFMDLQSKAQKASAWLEMHTNADGKIVGVGAMEIAKRRAVILDFKKKKPALKRRMTYKDKAINNNIKEVEDGLDAFRRDFGNDIINDLKTDLIDYNNALLEYAREGGILTTEQISGMRRDSEFYFPMKRHFDSWDRIGGRRVGKVGTSVKKRNLETTKGFEAGAVSRALESPVASLYDHTHDMLVKVDVNNKKRAVVDALFNVRHGATKVRGAGDHTVEIWRDGKKEYYQIPEEYSKEFDAMSLAPDWSMKLLHLPVRVLQKGAITYNPEFAIKNFTRDQVSSSFYSEHGYNPIINPLNTARGVLMAIQAQAGRESAKTKEVIDNWYASGAAMSTMNEILTAKENLYSPKQKEHSVVLLHEQIKGGLPAHQIREYNRRVSRFNAYMSKAGNNTIGAFGNFLSAVTTISETSTRLALYTNAYNKTGDHNLALKESRFGGADYGQSGSMQMIKWMSVMTPFINANLQHTYETVKTVSTKERAIKTAKLGGIIAMMSAGNWALHNLFYDDMMGYDDGRVKKEWDRASIHEKLHYWRIWIPHLNAMAKLPKGSFGMDFGTTIEAGLDYTQGNDPRLMDVLLGEIVKENLGTFTSIKSNAPQTSKATAIMNNWNDWTGRAVEPTYMQGISMYRRYDADTPQIFKKMGKMSEWVGINENYGGVSPKRLDAVTYALLGGGFYNVIDMGDKALQGLGVFEKNPTTTKEWVQGLPIIKTMFAREATGTRSSYTRDMFDITDEMSRLYNDYRDSLGAIDYETYKITTGSKRKAELLTHYMIHSQRGSNEIHKLKAAIGNMMKTSQQLADPKSLLYKVVSGLMGDVEDKEGTMEAFADYYRENAFEAIAFESESWYNNFQEYRSLSDDKSVAADDEAGYHRYRVSPKTLIYSHLNDERVMQLLGLDDVVKILTLKQGKKKRKK